MNSKIKSQLTLNLCTVKLIIFIFPPQKERLISVMHLLSMSLGIFFKGALVHIPSAWTAAMWSESQNNARDEWHYRSWQATQCMHWRLPSQSVTAINLQVAHKQDWMNSANHPYDIMYKFTRYTVQGPGYIHAKGIRAPPTVHFMHCWEHMLNAHAVLHWAGLVCGLLIILRSELLGSLKKEGHKVLE